MPKLFKQQIKITPAQYNQPEVRLAIIALKVALRRRRGHVNRPKMVNKQSLVYQDNSRTLLTGGQGHAIKRSKQKVPGMYEGL